VGGAPRDVRVQRHPLGMPSCVKDARERAYDAACQAPSDPPPLKLRRVSKPAIALATAGEAPCVP
jgi:hypothetical protein